MFKQIFFKKCKQLIPRTKLQPEFSVMEDQWNQTRMFILGNFDHFVLNIVQNVKFLWLKKDKKNVLKNQWILKLLKNDEFSTIMGLTVALWSDLKNCCQSNTLETSYYQTLQTFEMRICREIIHRVNIHFPLKIGIKMTVSAENCG